jgi:glycerophosphoryl diester phosphodiesterase
MTIEIWGHRGEGATDGKFAGSRSKGEVARHPENTLDSFVSAFEQGVRAVETDAIRTADNRIVLTHSTSYKDHVHPDKVRADRPFIDQLAHWEVRRLRTGYRPADLPPVLGGLSRIPALTELFTLLSDYPGRDTILNLELKDCQGTDYMRRTDPPIANTVLQELNNFGFPLQRVRFSSFSVDMLEELGRIAPRAKLALLTDIGPEGDGDVGKPIFPAAPTELYLPFTAEVVRTTRQRLPGLMAVHPEIRTLNEPALEACKELGLQVATWGWREQNPALPGEFQRAAGRAVGMCTEQGVPLQLITDYPSEMRYLLGQMGFSVKRPRTRLMAPAAV